MVNKAVKAFCELDIEKAGSCFPPEVRQYYENAVYNQDHDPDEIKSVKVKLEYVKELDNDEIESVISEHEHETGAHLEIKEAHLYEGEVTISTEEGIFTIDAFGGVLAVKIGGKWYALAQHI